jgi:hypothetical protein
MKVAIFFLIFFLNLLKIFNKKKYLSSQEDSKLSKIKDFNDLKWEDIYYDKRLINRNTYTDITVNEKIRPKRKYNLNGVFKNSHISLYKEFKEYQDYEDSDLEELN